MSALQDSPDLLHHLTSTHVYTLLKAVMFAATTGTAIPSEAL